MPSASHHTIGNSNDMSGEGRPRTWSTSSVPSASIGAATSFPPAQDRKRMSFRESLLGAGASRTKKRSKSFPSKSPSNTVIRTSFSQQSMDFIAEVPSGDDDEEQLPASPPHKRARSAQRQELQEYVLSSPEHEHGILSPQSSFFSESMGLEGEDYATTDEEGGDEATQSSNDPTVRLEEPVIFLGFQMPLWFSKHLNPSWNRTATLVVTKAPCFWCSRVFQNTDRAILQRLNILCAFFSLFQVGSGAFLTILLLVNGQWDRTLPPLNYTGLDADEDRGSESSRLSMLTALWNVNGNILLTGILALGVFSSTVLTVPMIRNVNIMGAIRYLWALLWIVPIQVRCTGPLMDSIQLRCCRSIPGFLCPCSDLLDY